MIKRLWIFFILFAVPLLAQEVTPAAADGGTCLLLTESYENAFIKMLLTLGALLVLICATLWAIKRFGRGQFGLGSSRTIKILERRPLSQKSMLYIVEVEGKRILVSESQFEVRALSPIEDEKGP